MLSQTTFHEFVLGAGFLILLVAGAILLGFDRAVPTEMWAMESALFGILTGTQLPSPAQRQQLARQADEMTALVSSVATMHAPTP